MTRSRNLATLPQEIAVDSSGNVQINGASGAYRINLSDPSNAFFGFKAGSALVVVVGQDSNGDAYLLNQHNATLRLGTNNIESVRINADGSLTMKTAAGLGYGTGSGGTVTQATSKSTAVTLNKPSGRITMNGAALAANTTVEFTFNNSLIVGGDMAIFSITGNAATAAAYNIGTRSLTNGSVIVGVRNVTAGSLSESLEIQYAIIKGATS